MIRFQCPGCATVFTTSDDKAGKTGRCPDCRTTFVIPTAPDAASPAAQPNSNKTPEPERDAPLSLPDPEPQMSPAADVTVPIRPCPGCGANLGVTETQLGQNVECPQCLQVFRAESIRDEAPTGGRASDTSGWDDTNSRGPERQSPRRIRRERDWGDQPEDDYPRRRRRRRAQKPGNVTAIGVMFLVGGIYGLLVMSGAVIGSLFVCCLWPFLYLQLIWSILAIVRGISLLGENDYQPPPRTLCILQIMTILNLDFVNAIMGIVGLILLNDAATLAYFEVRQPESED